MTSSTDPDKVHFTGSITVVIPAGVTGRGVVTRYGDELDVTPELRSENTDRVGRCFLDLIDDDGLIALAFLNLARNAEDRGIVADDNGVGVGRVPRGRECLALVEVEERVGGHEVGEVLALLHGLRKLLLLGYSTKVVTL